MLYLVILMYNQRQFRNVQYRDTSKVENMVRMGVPVSIQNIAKTAIASLYFQFYNPISYSGHPSGSKKYRFVKMWGGGGARGSYLSRGPTPIYPIYCMVTFLSGTSNVMIETQRKPWMVLCKHYDDEKISRYAYMLWKNITLCRDIVIVYHY